MADNIELNLGSGGSTVSTDELAGGIHVQRVKMQTGVEGVSADVNASNPMHSQEVSRDVRYRTYEDTSFVVGDSPVTHNFFSDEGRLGSEFNIVNDGAGDILVQVSDDGVTYSTSRTVKQLESFGLGNMTVHSVRITHVADSAYRLVVA